jgi:predicted RNA binding protein YcfA (HicA-like mRNA interferase family)
MTRILPTDWQTQIKIFELYGCRYKRKKGSHHVLTFAGAKRAVVIPEYDEIDVDIIKSNMRPRHSTRISTSRLINHLTSKECHLALLADMGSVCSAC